MGDEIQIRTVRWRARHPPGPWPQMALGARLTRSNSDALGASLRRLRAAAQAVLPPPAAGPAAAASATPRRTGT